MLRKHFSKLGHHILEGPFMAGDSVRFRKHVVHAELFEIFFQLSHHYVPQGHSGGSDLGTYNLEASGNLRGCFANRFILESLHQGGIGGKARQYRHQVGFSGAVVSDYQQSFIVCRLIELHMRDCNLSEPFRHFF